MKYHVPHPGLIASVTKFSPTKLNQTEFLTNKGINSYLFTEGALDISPTKRNLLLILEISHHYQLVRSAILFNLDSRLALGERK